MEILAERRWIDPYSPYPRRPGSASRPGPRHPPQKMPHSCHASHLASPGFESSRWLARIVYPSVTRVCISLLFVRRAVVWLVHYSTLRRR